MNTFGSAQGAPVLAKSNAEKIGEVKHFVVEQGKVRALHVEGGKHGRLVGWDDVVFGDDAVVVESVDVLRDAIDDREARALRGERVLIVGASGAVGTLAVQIARALGAQVMGVCAERNVGLVTELGADHVIDYQHEDVASGADRYDVVLDIGTELGADHVIDYQHEDVASGADRYDVVLDIGGNSSVRRLRRTLTAGGRLVIIGGEGGEGGGPVLGGIQRQLGATFWSLLVREQLGTVIAHDGGGALEGLRALVDSAGIAPVLGDTYTLSDTPEAVRALEAGRTAGRLVITP